MLHISHAAGAPEEVGRWAAESFNDFSPRFAPPPVFRQQPAKPRRHRQPELGQLRALFQEGQNAHASGRDYQADKAAAPHFHMQRSRGPLFLIRRSPALNNSLALIDAFIRYCRARCCAITAYFASIYHRLCFSSSALSWRRAKSAQWFATLLFILDAQPPILQRRRHATNIYYTPAHTAAPDGQAADIVRTKSPPPPRLFPRRPPGLPD